MATSRPSISLALILKNEEKNINRLLDSVEGCFDEIVVADTGSTDKTKEICEARGCKVFDFKWIDNFAAARNFAFSKATCEYIAWLDGDDCLHNRDAFIKWRDHAMEFGDYFLAPYHYALDKEGKPLITFVRERVFKRKINPTWVYDVHEGVLPQPGWRISQITTWAVDHHRDAEDVKQDRSRNIKIVEKMKKEGRLDARMQFYYAKELYENNQPFDAIREFDDALELELQPHDKILALQYAGYASLAVHDSLKEELKDERLKAVDKAIEYALKGIKMDPHRAEFHALAGDAYLRVGNLAACVPYFAAAKASLANTESKHAKPTFQFKHLYKEAPTLQLSKIYLHLGLLDKAKAEAKEAIEKYDSVEGKKILEELERIEKLVTVKQNQVETDEIVFTCPPQTAYEFDEEIYKTKPLGGSETALVQMAKWLHKKTKRRVIVFNMRKERLVSESGVEYRPTTELNQYMSQFKPGVEIKWRHNIKTTDAPSYLWCHDLFTPGVEQIQNFDYFLALSPFHKNYTMGLQGVDEDKIIVTRNGIDPEKFKFERKPKDPNKIVWMSSPDRGLDRCIDVMELVREKFPDAKLHVYYGIEGLYKYGPQMSALADHLKAKMAQRDWIIYHGFTEQNKMYQEVSDAVVWCHPNDFIETYCISAIECLSNGIFPVVRRLGALADTLKCAEDKGKAILLDYAWDDPEGKNMHANAVISVLQNKSWEGMDFKADDWAWEKVADDWIDMMKLNQDNLHEKTA